MIKPLFMWAGGKNKMLKHYRTHIPEKIENYCEPFFGGGAMFIEVVTTRQPKLVIINDSNISLISIYRSVRDNYEEFLAYFGKLESLYMPLSHPDRKEFYYSLRHRHAFEHDKMNQTEEAATLYFLMKTCFNGIYQLNNNTAGRFGTPAGLLNHRKHVADRQSLEWWHGALQKVTILSEDWKTAVEQAPHDSFFFLDPPYRGCFTTYGQKFTDGEQLKLLQWAAVQKNVMLCNRDLDDSFWEKEDHGMELLKFPVTYTAGRRKSTAEGFVAKKATEVLLLKNCYSKQ